jgi:hypothetical protein
MLVTAIISRVSGPLYDHAMFWSVQVLTGESKLARKRIGDADGRGAGFVVGVTVKKRASDNERVKKR